MTAPRAKSGGLSVVACNTWLQKSALTAMASQRMAGRDGIGQPVKTIDQTGPGIVQRRDHIGQKIRRHPHIGIADQNQRVFRQPFQLDQGGHLAAGAQRFAADNQLRIMAGNFFNQLTDDPANRIVGVRDTEEDLHRAGIILVEPALQRGGGGVIAAFERFEQGDGRGKGRFVDAPVQRKPHGGEPLPENEGETQQCQDGQGGFGKIHRGKQTPNQAVAPEILCSGCSSSTSTPCGGRS